MGDEDEEVEGLSGAVGDANICCGCCCGCYCCGCSFCNCNY